MIIIVLRIRKAIQGTKVNVKKTIIFSAYFVAISSFLVSNSFLIGSVPVVYVIPYFVVVVAAIYCSYIHSKRTLSFLKSPDSTSGNSAIYVKGGLSIYFLYVAALTIRIVINFLFIASERFYFGGNMTSATGGGGGNMTSATGGGGGNMTSATGGGGGNMTSAAAGMNATARPPTPSNTLQTAFFYSVIKKWGSSGKGNGQFSTPYGVAVDSSGNVYVADYDNDRVQKFSSDGSFITKWGSSGKGNGQFSTPRGVAVDSSGNVYVTDYDNDRVQKFSSDGSFITKWGSSGAEGVAVDSSGNVYVADYDNDRVQKFMASVTP